MTYINFTMEYNVKGDDMKMKTREIPCTILCTITIRLFPTNSPMKVPLNGPKMAEKEKIINVTTNKKHSRQT